MCQALKNNFYDVIFQLKAMQELEWKTKYRKRSKCVVHKKCNEFRVLLLKVEQAEGEKNWHRQHT